MKYGRVGFIGRFKPLHKGASDILESLCESADHLIIGIGSANQYNARNPFTAKESKKMIDVFLAHHNNYSIVFLNDSGHIPQYADGMKWVEETTHSMGP